MVSEIPIHIGFIKTKPKLDSKIYLKLKIEKSINSFHNDKTKKDGRKALCVERRRADNNRKITCECGKQISFSNKKTCL
jgi:hypothetical protein